jgi:hypothetical protein
VGREKRGAAYQLKGVWTALVKTKSKILSPKGKGAFTRSVLKGPSHIDENN